MKKFGIFAAVLMFCAAAGAWGDDYVWAGSDYDEWAVPSSWTGGAGNYPGESDDDDTANISFSGAALNINFSSSLGHRVRTLILKDVDLSLSESIDILNLTVTGSDVDVASNVSLEGGEIQIVSGVVHLVTAATLTADAAINAEKGIELDDDVSDLFSLTLTSIDHIDINAAISGLGSLETNGTTHLHGDITTVDTQTYKGLTDFDTDVTLEGSTVIFIGVVDGDTNNLTIDGNAEFGDTVTNVVDLEVTGVTVIKGTSISTSGPQTYTGDVTLESSTTLEADDDDISFNAKVNGTIELIVNAGAGAVKFTGTVGDNDPLDSLEVTGPTTITAGITTTGDQTYHSAVTLGASVVLIANDTGTPALVTFESTVGNASPRSLTIGSSTIASDASFGGVVGNVTALGSVSVYGETAINGASISAGTQTYYDEVTLAGSGKTLTGTTITFKGDISGPSALTINGATVFDTNATEITTGHQIYYGTVTLIGSDKIITASIATFSDTLTGDDDYDLIINGSTEFSGVVSNIGNLSVSGSNTTINIANITESITTSGTQYYDSNVNLRSNTILDGTTITLGHVDGGSGIFYDLTITGDAEFEGTVSYVGVLSVSGISNINTTSISTTGSQTYADDVTLASSTTLEADDDDISFNAKVDGPFALTVNAGSGTVGFTGTVGGDDLLDSLEVTGPTTISANITTTGAQTYHSAVTLGADVALIANNAGTSALVTFGSTVGNASSRSLTIGGNSTTIVSNASFGGAVGSGTALSSILVYGTTALSGNTSIATTGAQTYTGAVSGDHNLSVAAGSGAVIFDGGIGTSGSPLGTTGAARSLEVTTGVSVTFTGDVYTKWGAAITPAATLKGNTYSFNRSNDATAAGNLSFGAILLDPPSSGNVLIQTGAVPGTPQGDISITGQITCGSSFGGNFTIRAGAGANGSVTLTAGAYCPQEVGNQFFLIDANVLNLAASKTISAGALSPPTTNSVLELSVNSISPMPSTLAFIADIVRVYPRDGKDIEYSVLPRSTVSPVSAAVHYVPFGDAFPSDVVLGGPSYGGKIYVNKVSGSTKNLTIETSSPDGIYFIQQYANTSAGETLTLNAPKVYFDNTLDSAAADPVKISLTDAPFDINIPITLNGSTNASITAAGITLGSTVSGGASPGDNNLLLDASAANTYTVKVTGPVGEGGALVALGDIEVRSINPTVPTLATPTDPYGVTFTGAVTAKSYTQTGAGGTGGTGSTLFSGEQKYTEGFSFTGTDLTVGAALTTDTDGSGDDGAITITNARDVQFNGPVSATSFTQLAGSGTTTINDDQEYAEGFSFEGTDLTVDAALTTAVGAANTITIANSETFTLTSGAQISSGGAFSQIGTGVSVANEIASDITTTNATAADASISFAGPVTITDDAEFNTSLGKGNITFKDTVDSVSSSLTLNAGTASGVITFYDAVDMGDGDIDVTAHSVTTNSSSTPLDITAAAFTIEAGTNVDPLGIMIITGVTVNEGTINAGPLTTTGTAITFDGYYNGLSGELKGENNTPNAIVFKGNADLGTFTHNSDIIVFDGTPGTSHNLSHKTVSASDLAAHKTLGRVEINAGNTVTLTTNIVQDSGSQSSPTPASGDHILLLAANSELNTDTFNWLMGTEIAPAKPSQIGGTFAGFYGYQGDIEFSASSKLVTIDYFADEDSTTPLHKHRAIFTGAGEIVASGDVIINEEFSGVITNSTITMTGDGGQLIVRAVTPPAPAPARPDTVIRLGNFIAAASGDGTIISSDLIFAGDLTIKSGKTLLAGADATDTHHIRVEGNWTQTGGTFTPQHSTVEFGEQGHSSPRTFVISGNSTWYMLACYEPRAEIQFSNYPDIHTVTFRFEIEPRTSGGAKDETAASLILLTRKDDPNPSYPQPNPGTGDYIPPTTPDANFWYFDLQIGATMRMHYVYLNYSYSVNRIPLPINNDTIIIATPYVYMTGVSTVGSYNLGTPRLEPNLSTTGPTWYTTNGSYYNVNWLVNDRFLYSFTEDSDGNGKIDRIRAQAAFSVTDDVTGFKAVVEGYTVKGYARADQAVRNPPFDGSPADNLKKDSMIDIIYIFLEEQNYSDTGARPVWWVESNTTIKDLVTESINIKLPYAERLTADDNAPPRLTYALTVPDALYTRSGFSSDHGEIFVQFSEPVDGGSLEATPPTAITGASGHTIIEGIKPVSDREFIIPLDSAYTVAELAVPSLDTFTLDGRMQDFANYASDKRSNPTLLYNYQYPSPKYPTDWDFREYVEVRGDPLQDSVNKPFDTVPPSGFANVPETVPKRNVTTAAPLIDTGNKVIAPNPNMTHRVTDALISVPPSSGSSTSYFVWPVWAMYTDPANHISVGNDFWGQQSTDTGLIWDFTGKKYLEDRDITLQVRVNNVLSDSPILYYGINIPREDRYPQEVSVDGNKTGGLWLPNPGVTPGYINLAPDFYTGPGVGTAAPTSVAPKLYNYSFTKDMYDSVSRFDFMFLLSSVSTLQKDLFALRLDIAPGAAIPSDWYRLVRPFDFEIHDITLQRSGVTILNNVINPTNGESTYVQYHLTKGGQVTIQVFTMDGTMVDVLYRGYREAGEYRAVWNGTNRGGRAVARGMYFIRVVGPEIDEIRKVMVVK